MILKTRKQGRSRGNVKKQKQRRKERKAAGVQPLDEAVYLIDGNFSKYAVGYCKYYHGCLTLGLLETHKCNARSCKNLVIIEDGQD